MALVLVINLTSCGGEEKAVSQEPSNTFQEKVPLSRQISEVSPPATIQELRQLLEVYEPQVSILTPKQDEILQENVVNVRFQVKDLPIFKDKEWELGPHLHVILDNEPYIAVYDLDQPLVLPDLSPGTHSLRVFASRPWHESFKNEGAYAQSTFHVFTKTDDNNPDPALPVLTYSRPKGSYGAEPILLDFYLTNAPLHLVAQENPDDQVADWRIRCTINGESFVLDRWQAVHLKGFKPGKNWVKLEFIDEQGNPVKNVFNSTVRLIDYEPKGQDTLSRIVRGELTADQVRSIVDPNYTAKIPVTEPTPTPIPTSEPTIEETPQEKALEEEKPLVPETEPVPSPTLTPGTQEKTPLVPETEPAPSPALTPGSTEKAPETQPAPKTDSEQAPQAQRFQSQLDETSPDEITSQPTLNEPTTLPEIVIESPASEPTELQPEAMPKADTETLPKKLAPDPDNPELNKYFSPEQYPTSPAPSPTLPETSPDVIEPPSVLETLEDATTSDEQP